MRQNRPNTITPRRSLPYSGTTTLPCLAKTVVVPFRRLRLGGLVKLNTIFIFIIGSLIIFCFTKTCNAKIINQPVPFTVQAPFGNWADDRQQNACEETSVIMAMAWANKTSLIKTTALKQILAIAAWEQKNYGNYVDTDATSTAERLLTGYFNYKNWKIKTTIKLPDLISILSQGKLILAPCNGQKLHNPHFQQPGPLQHMLVIKGYDDQTKEFITNDPGTKFGADYRYPATVLYNALRAYPTGHHLPITGNEKTIIIVSR